MFNFNNYSAKSKFHDNSNALVVGKIKDEIASLPIKEFVGLMAKLYLCLVDDSSEHKKLKGGNKNSVDKINHNCYNDGLLGEKYLRHSINRIQGKNRKMGTYAIKKNSLSCFNDKAYIFNGGFDAYLLVLKLNLLSVSKNLFL